MSRARNAVIIIILCIIGAYSVRKGPQLGLNMPGLEDIKDAVAGGPVNAGRRGNANPLTLASGNGEEMRDAVAGHAVGTPNNGNTLGDVDGPPRGSGNGGFGPSANNPGPIIPPPGSLSPSGPTTTSNENPGDETPGEIPTPCNQGQGEGAGQGCINGGGNRD